MRCEMSEVWLVSLAFSGIMTSRVLLQHFLFIAGDGSCGVHLQFH